MGTPIYVLAGQSNAVAMAAEFSDALRKFVQPNQYHKVTVATGGAPLTRERGGDDWLNPDELRKELYVSIRALLEQDSSAYLGGVIWVQGESDTYATGRADDYSEMLQALFAEIGQSLTRDFPDRQVLAGDVDLVISGLSNLAPYAPKRVNWNEVRAQQIDLAQSSDAVQFIDPDVIAGQNGVNAKGMFEDGLHYSDTFQVLQMEALVKALVVNGAQTPNDWFHQGTTGADHFVGSQADDVYVVNHSGDRIVEGARQGFDTVQSDQTVRLNDLSKHIEAVVLAGHQNTKAIGNRRQNELEGNDGNNVLKGRQSHDLLEGKAGHDRLFGGSGNDTLIGGTGWDRYIGGSGHDTFVFTDADVRWREKIMDYNDAQDIIRIETQEKLSFDDLGIRNDSSGKGAIVNYGSGSFLLVGVDKSVLDAEDFDFV